MVPKHLVINACECISYNFKPCTQLFDTKISAETCGKSQKKEIPERCTVEKITGRGVNDF